MVAEQCRSAVSSIIDVLVPLVIEEIMKAVRLISQEHIQRRVVEETVDVSVPQDAIEDCNKDQLSNTTARIEAVEKSISELHECVTKDTEIRQKQHSEVMTLIANNVAATDMLKLAVNRLHETQRQVLAGQTLQKTVEMPQAQFLDRMVDVPAVMQRQTPQKTIEETKVPKIVSQDRIPLNRLWKFQFLR